MAKIAVLELNQIFDSIAAAARAVGVDASNARKVLRGKRQSAGGYHFAEVSGQAGIDTAAANVQQRARHKAKRRILDKHHRNLVDAVHDRLVDVNKRARNARKEGLLESDKTLQKMLSHTDFYGGNKTGGYQTSKTHLRQFDAAELKNLLEMLGKEQREYAENVYNSKTRNLASYAAQFGISEQDAKKYYHIFPAIFELFKAAKQQELYNYETIVTSEIYDAMQGDADPDDLLDYVLDLTNVYKGNTTDDLESILDKWSSARDVWQGREYEEFEDE